MKIFITSLLILFLVSLSSITKAQQSFNGNWTWSDGTGVSTMTLNIQQTGNTISGRHCCIFDSGNHIDCDEDSTTKTITGTITDSQANIVFTSSFSLKAGKAIIKKIDNNTIEWIITEAPSGVFYLPLDAILKRE